MARVNQNGTTNVYHWLPCDLCGNVRSTTDEVSWVRPEPSGKPAKLHNILVCKSCKAKRTD